jgi:UDP-N-acetylglucosamine/UDP-N-acetylgalactosamine diphosphorylase
MEAVQSVLHKLHMGGSSETAAPLKEPTQDDLAALREKYEKAKQEQVFAFYDELSSAEKATLYQQLADIDPEHINQITHRALNPSKPENDGKESGLEPLPDSATASILDSKAEDIEKWYQSGLDLIAANKVAVVLMAGGQGTRLGSSAPKGCFDIGLPSKKSLFQIQAERIRRIEHLAHKKAGHKDDKKVVVPWYVMTSGPTRGPTEQYFEEHKYFGLEKENVIIFEQGVLPCISNEGKILLESKSKVGVYNINPNYQLTLATGCSSSRWEWRDLPSPCNVKCHGRHAKTGHRTHSCLLC